nr:unnamed protein product [Callosobruchus analis]
MSKKKSVPSRSLSKQDELLHAQAQYFRKLEDTQLTRSQKLKRFIYNPKKQEFFGRTPSSWKLYTPEQLLLLYKAQIRPSLEYYSCVGDSAPKQPLWLLDSIQSRDIRLINAPNLTKDLHSLEHSRRVAGLSLFYRFYHGRCSSEVSQIITPKGVRMRNTRNALHAYPYQVAVPSPSTSLLQHSFIWKTSTLWNELPASLFPD